MDISELASAFRSLFSGMERAYGTYCDIQPDPTRTDGKTKGKALTIRKPVTPQLWESHLRGDSGLGIIPIRENNTACFGAIDIDVYDGINAEVIAQTFAEMKLPLVVCRSKSGGIHAFLFSGVPVPASKMRSKLREIAALIGHGTAECFPKQSALHEDGKDLGSWLNCPYFNCEQTTRYAVNAEGAQLGATEFLAYAERSKVDASFFEKSHSGDKCPTEFKDGPPCLATLVQIGFPEGSRNNGLYNLAVFAKRRFPDEWQRKVTEFNDRFMNPPLPYAEVQQVISSCTKGKEYRFKCSDSPIAQHCNAGVCRTRRYGVGGGLMPEFGSLSQQKGDTVFWYWSVNGQRIRLTTEELFRFNKFRERCAEALCVVVPGMKQADWDAVIARAMATCEVIPVAEDATAAGALWELVERFTQWKAETMEAMLAGISNVFHAEDGRTYFRLQGLTDFLRRNAFREMERGEISRVLEQHGGKHHKENVGRGKERTTRNFWSIPTPVRYRPQEPPLEGPGFF